MKVSLCKCYFLFLVLVIKLVFIDKKFKEFFREAKKLLVDSSGGVKRPRKKDVISSQPLQPLTVDSELSVKKANEGKTDSSLVSQTLPVLSKLN
jgi:hypothetical protein